MYGTIKPLQPDGAKLNTTKSANQFCLRLLIAITILGGVMRLRQYLSFPAFWENEVAVLMNTRAYPASQLPFIHLNAYNDLNPVAAPPIFLLVTKWMGDYFHYAEWSVRLLPLICSLAAMGLFSHLAWRLLEPAAAVWAVALMAFSDQLIFQAGNIKPYSGDVFVAILIAWVAFAAKPNAPAWKRLVVATVLTAVGVWISYTAVFVLAAVGLSLLPELDKNRLRALVRLSLCVLPAVASFGVVYILSIRPQRDANLDLHWVHSFPDWARPWTVPWFFIGGTWELFRYMFYPIGFIMLAAFVLGIRLLLRRGKTQMLVLLAGPLAFDLAGAFAKQYPYGGSRILLYLTPFISLLSGIGAASATAQFRRAGIWLQLAVSTVPITAAAIAVYGLFIPQNYGNLRDALGYLNANRKPDESVYLMNDQTNGPAEWYWPRPDALVHSVPEAQRIHGDDFWLVICFKTRRYKEVQPDMRQPDSVVDWSRSFHTNGADVWWFVPKK
jgi:hypothetical protein